MSEKPGIHVVPTDDGWATIRDNGSRHRDAAPRQQDVIDVARDRARREGVELYIHGRDGQIRARDSYGNDPYPPRG